MHDVIAFAQYTAQNGFKCALIWQLSLGEDRRDERDWAL